MEKRPKMANSGNDQLTATQERLIAALLQHTKIKDAAAAAGIAERTARSYMSLPAFKAAYEQAKQELFAEALDFIQIESVKSARVIAEMRDDPECPYPTRLKAAHILGSRLTDVKPAEPANGADQLQNGVFSHQLLPFLSNEELNQIEHIVHLAEQRKAEAEANQP